MTNKRIGLFFDILAFFAALVYFVVLFINIDYFKGVHGDIYQYIYDAESYAKIEFPHLIQLQPLTPILIAIFQPLFANYQFPYFAAAKFLNIFAASGSFLFLYLILKENTNRRLAILIAVFCSIHPLSIAIGLNITNVGLYSFFVLGTLYFMRKNEKLFFSMALLAFFVRIEGLILLAVYVLDNFSLKKIKNQLLIGKKETIKKNLPLLLTILIVIIWSTIQTIHNYKNDTPFGNYYLYEIITRRFDPNNFVYILGLIGSLFFPKDFPWYGVKPLELSGFALFLAFLSVLILIKILITRKSRIYGYYLLLLATIHLLFPAIEYRYYYLFLNVLIIGIVTAAYPFYTGSKKIIQNILKILIVVLIFWYLKFLLIQFNEEVKDYRDLSIELEHQASSWLFNELENGNYYIIADKNYLYYDIFLNSKEFFDKDKNHDRQISVNYDDYVVQIQKSGKSLNFLRLDRIKNKCETVKCLLQIIKDEKANFIFIYDEGFELWSKDDYWAQKNGSLLIKDIILEKKCEQKIIVSLKYYEMNRLISSLDKNCYLK